MIAKSYTSKLFNLPIIITRFSNIYGPGQLNFTALIPDSIRSCILNKKFVIRGNGESIRDYIYINDAVKMTLKSMNSEMVGNFNIGSGISNKTSDIIRIFKIYYHL